MSEPFIFIGTHAIRQGKTEEFKQYLPEFMEIVETHEPRLIHFAAYFNDDGSEVVFVQVHPDADSMLFHMRVVSEHVRDAYETFLDATVGIQVYGKASDAALQMMQQLAGSGVPVSVMPEYKGFNRLSVAVGA